SLRLGDPDAAQKELDHALQAGAGEAQLRPLAIEILLARAHFDEAAQILASDASLPKAQRLTWLSAAQLGLGKVADAESSLKEALSWAPNDAGALLQQARLFARTDRFDAALESVDRALQQQPQRADGWLLRGNLLLQRGSFGDAVTAFRKGIEANRQSFDLP